MAKGNQIIVSDDPRGRFIEGVISGTPKPGTVMEIKWTVAAGGPSGMDFTYEAYGTTAADGVKGVGADGDRRTIYVLDRNKLEGVVATTAYVDGERAFLYVPVAGEDLNMILQDVAGTGDDHAIGDTLMVDDGTGKLLATTGDPESEPFQVLEVVTDPVADTLTLCRYTGQ